MQQPQQPICAYRIQSWNELQDALFDNSWKEDIQRFRSNFVYRGTCDAQFTLHTSLQRLGGAYEQLEKHLLRNFRKYAHRDVIQEQTIWDWLSLAQHHGLPTRLLDWTYSPYVALHFALANLEEYDRDGAIWCVDYVRLHELLPTKLKYIIEKEGCNAFTTSLLHQGAESLEKFDNLSEDPYLLFFEPPSLDDRIVNQYALFSILSSSKTILDDWLQIHPGFTQKIIIPADLKWEIRDKLDQINITERVLFPGLGGLCAWLKRHYSPKRAQK